MKCVKISRYKTIIPYFNHLMREFYEKPENRNLTFVPPEPKVELLGCYIQPIDQIQNAIDGEIDCVEIGDKIELEIIEMDQAVYEAMPEFKGY